MKKTEKQEGFGTKVFRTKRYGRCMKANSEISNIDLRGKIKHTGISKTV